MSGFFGFLAFAAVVCLIIGLIKPSVMVFWSKKKSRGMASLIYGAAFIVFVIVACATGNSKTATPVPVSASAISSQASTVSKTTSSAVSKTVSSAVKKDDGKITKAKFDQIQNGMSYDQVKQIIGSEGELLSEAGTKGDQYYTVVYDWKSSDGISNATFEFQGDKLQVKSQVGLK